MDWTFPFLFPFPSLQPPSPPPPSFPTPTSRPDCIPRAPLSAPSLAVSRPSLSRLPCRPPPDNNQEVDDLSRLSDQALWPAGPTIRSSGDTVFRVFLGEAVNISTGEDCLENPAASRSGARLAEERGRQTGAWPQIVVAIERSHYRQR